MGGSSELTVKRSEFVVQIEEGLTVAAGGQG